MVLSLPLLYIYSTFLTKENTEPESISSHSHQTYKSVLLCKKGLKINCVREQTNGPTACENEQIQVFSLYKKYIYSILPNKKLNCIY